MTIMSRLRCRLLGHRWGEWQHDSSWMAWYRSCQRSGGHGEARFGNAWYRPA